MNAVPLQAPFALRFKAYRDALVHDWMQIIAVLGVALIPLFLLLDYVTMPRELLSRFAIYRGADENVVFTNTISKDDLASLEGLAFSPMTFQEKLDKRVELRATVVGNRVLTAAVDSQALEGAKLDWRKEGVTLLDAWTKYELPRSVERGLLKLTKWFGLNYAAADFIVTPEGRHVFLEINAGGEFYWLQRTPGLPIVEALAEMLVGKAKHVDSGEA